MGVLYKMSQSGWIKCSERMPECQPNKWSKEVAAVSELGGVFNLSAMGNYWQRSKAFIESGTQEITHWIPLPED